MGLDFLGEERLSQGRLDEAEKAIEEGIQVREKFSPEDLDFHGGEWAL